MDFGKIFGNAMPLITQISVANLKNYRRFKRHFDHDETAYDTRESINFSR